MEHLGCSGSLLVGMRLQVTDRLRRDHLLQFVLLFEWEKNNLAVINDGFSWC